MEQLASDEPAWLCQRLPMVIANTRAARTMIGISKQRVGFGLGTLQRLATAPDQHHIRDGSERQRVVLRKPPRRQIRAGIGALEGGDESGARSCG